MKKIFYLSIALISVLVFRLSSVYAQGVSINSSGTIPDNSAMLDIGSTNKGALVPRMVTSQRDAISAPATGLIIYNTDCNALNIYNGTAWISIGNIGGINTPGSNTGNSAPCQNSSG